MSGGAVDADYVIGTVYQTASYLGNTTVPFVEKGWNHMTDTYSEFTIETLFSIILHEVSPLMKPGGRCRRLYTEILHFCAM